MLYIVILILLICLVYHYDYRYNRYGRKEWYIICSIIYILVAGLRYRLGIDTIEYESEYPYMYDLELYLSYNFEQERYGRGFLLLASIAKTISHEFVALQLLHAVFITSIIFWFFYKYSNHPFLSILLYSIICYFPLTFEVMRESCAVCMLLIGWKYFLNDKWIKYYLCAIVAILFHISGSIMLILPIFYLPMFRFLFKMGTGFIITIIIVFVISFVLSVKFFDLIRLVEIADIDSYASIYENSKYAESTLPSVIGIIAFFVKNLFYPVMAINILNNKHVIKDSVLIDKNYINKLEYMFCWSVYIAIMTLFIKIFYRFNNYFYLFAILAIADASFKQFRYSHNKRIKLSFGIWMLFIVPYLSISLSGMFSEDGESGKWLIRRYYPYESVLNPIRDKDRESLYSFYGR